MSKRSKSPDVPVIMQTIHRPTGTVLVNEQCTCGHLKSSHGDTVAPYHGACKLAGCNCVRFTWTSFVTREGRSLA